MKRLFKRHRVRSTFYHGVAGVFLYSTLLWSLDIISDRTSTIIAGLLFVIDYLAEMYDPNPDCMGSWYERHFHRILNDDDEDE